MGAAWLGVSVVAAAGEPREWLTATARELAEGCRVRADAGTWLYTPDGKGNYRALWTRDFAYLVENAGDLVPVRDVEDCLRTLIRAVREDGAAPDRVQPDGTAVYVAGPADHPLGEPNIDNAQFLVLAVNAHLHRLTDEKAIRLFREWAPALRRAMDYLPRSPAGLVWNDPRHPHSPYGFTDCVGKTGELFFESLLYWQAARRLESLCRQFSDAETLAAEFGTRAQSIERQLDRLWDNEAGLYLAASQDCRQVDIWGNAFAVWIDFPLGDRRARLLAALRDLRESYLWHGQVRHLVKGEYWQRLLTPVPRERYQNGAYWATASGWVMYALAQTDRELAVQVWRDLIADFQGNGVCECVNESYRQLPSYVVSAANPLAAARRLNLR